MPVPTPAVHATSSIETCSIPRSSTSLAAASRIRRRLRAASARSLLATLSPGHYLHARRALGWEVERLKRGWAALCAAVSASGS